MFEGRLLMKLTAPQPEPSTTSLGLPGDLVESSKLAYTYTRSRQVHVPSFKKA